MTTEVEEQLGGIRVVKAFGNEELASSKVESAISGNLQYFTRIFKLKNKIYSNV
jgi:ABC-type multidrug transport system fused ATPase/permease subunit